MRIFLAVFPPPEVQAAAHHAVGQWRARGDGVSWVAPANLHFTLRFLGEQPDEAVARAEAAARATASQHVPFGAALGGFGAFPTARRARVIWLGLSQGSEPLRRLAISLEEALRAEDFPPDDPEFEPHLTLARIRASADWTSRLIAAPAVEGRFRVEELALVKSTLAAGGARYEPIARVRLGARAAAPGRA